MIFMGYLSFNAPSQEDRGLVQIMRPLALSPTLPPPRECVCARTSARVCFLFPFAILVNYRSSKQRLFRPLL